MARPPGVAWPDAGETQLTLNEKARVISERRWGDPAADIAKPVSSGFGPKR